MADMLVNLLQLKEAPPAVLGQGADEITICRAIAPDKHRVLEWALEHVTPSAASECDVCFSRTPVSCFLALRNNKIVGVACYNAIAPDFFGPLHVADETRGAGVGRALLLNCLWSLRAEGYVYGIIGGVGPQEFYEKCAGATLIPGSTPGIYRWFLGARR